VKRRTGRVYRFFLLIACIAACAVSGCFDAVGSIGGPSAAGDLFWIVPSRVTYEIYDLFLRNNDLRVFTSYRGTVESIPLENVKIGIAENPDLRNNLKDVPADENYPLDTAGRKIVVVEYEGMSDNYSIEVRDPNGLGGGNGPGGEGGSGIEIEWEQDVPVTPR
jgi:hypothetical protein